jgi:hypothetical protein
MLNLPAIISTASENETFSFSWINRKISPALPLLKHLNIFFTGMAKNDGVFSSLNGLRPRQLDPHLFRLT